MERNIPFHILKLIASILIAFYKPQYVTYVVAFNILVTITFSSPTLTFAALMLTYILPFGIYLFVDT